MALVGQEAYEIRTRDLISAEEISLGKYRGTPVYLVFFYTLCQPCQREMQRIVDNRYAFEQSGIQVIGIAMDRWEEDVKAYIKDKGIFFPVGLANPSIAMLYEDVRIVPFTYLIGGDGVVKAQYMGRIPDDKFSQMLEQVAP